MAKRNTSPRPLSSIVLSVLAFCLAFSACKVQHETGTDSNRYDLNTSENKAESAEIVEMIAPYKADLDEEMNQVIGKAEKELFKKLPEGTLNNWAADAIFDQSNKLFDTPVDFAVVNFGGIRIGSLPAGDVTVGRVFELMPFDNVLVIMKVDGGIVRQLFENIAGRGGWPVSKGVVCRFTEGGELLGVTINGKAITPDKTYRIGISDYIANGGDKCSFFIGQPRDETAVLFRDAFMQQVRDLTAAGQPVTASVDGRMLVE